jgi:hypothetical protein
VCESVHLKEAWKNGTSSARGSMTLPSQSHAGSGGQEGPIQVPQLLLWNSCLLTTCPKSSIWVCLTKDRRDFSLPSCRGPGILGLCVCGWGWRAL